MASPTVMSPSPLLTLTLFCSSSSNKAKLTICRRTANYSNLAVCINFREIYGYSKVRINDAICLAIRGRSILSNPYIPNLCFTCNYKQKIIANLFKVGRQVAVCFDC